MKLFIDEKLRYFTKRSNEILQYRVVNLVNDKNLKKCCHSYILILKFTIYPPDIQFSTLPDQSFAWAHW